MPEIEHTITNPVNHGEGSGDPWNCGIRPTGAMPSVERRPGTRTPNDLATQRRWARCAAGCIAAFRIPEVLSINGLTKRVRQFGVC